LVRFSCSRFDVLLGRIDHSSIFIAMPLSITGRPLIRFRIVSSVVSSTLAPGDIGRHCFRLSWESPVFVYRYRHAVSEIISVGVHAQTSRHSLPGATAGNAGIVRLKEIDQSKRSEYRTQADNDGKRHDGADDADHHDV
jgi:hypothetical protein